TTRIAVGNACVEFVPGNLIQFIAGCLIPVTSVRGSVTSHLVRRENHVTHSFFYKRGEYALVARRLWQPHRFRFATETITKVCKSPANLRPQIPFVAERQNRVAVSLSNRVAVPGMSRDAFPIGLNYSLVGVAVMLRKPAQQRGPKIKTNVRIVVDCARLSVI